MFWMEINLYNCFYVEQWKLTGERHIDVVSFYSLVLLYHMTALSKEENILHAIFLVFWMDWLQTLMTCVLFLSVIDLGPYLTSWKSLGLFQEMAKLMKKRWIIFDMWQGNSNSCYPLKVCGHSLFQMLESST